MVPACDDLAVYDFVLVDGKQVEVCDDCGFNGAAVADDAVGPRLRAMWQSWCAACDNDESLLRARPASATWCAVEYSSHTAFALQAIEWAAREFLAGRAANWASLPYTSIPSEDANEENHDCMQTPVDRVLSELERATTSMAAFADRLTEAETVVTQDYGGGLLLSVGTVVRHALHDAEHHVLDIRRGIAKLILTR